MKKILLLADINSEHTQKWALGLADHGFKIGIYSFNRSGYDWIKQHPNITVLYQTEEKPQSESLFTKFSYIRHVKPLKKAIQQFKPDILHAHYATSYGLVGALSGFHPFIISAWGTDVMKFPEQHIINRSILKYNLSKADVLCATSETIKTYIHQVLSKPVEVIPFGVDLNKFKPLKVSSLFAEQQRVIGCVKSLKSVYNIDVVIKAFKLLKDKGVENIKLLIVGDGSLKGELQNLVKELHLESEVVFSGRISQEEIPKYLNMLDVLVNVSEYESFGVSVVEAMACEIPVVVTNVGGLKEVVDSRNIGALVGVGDVDETADAVLEILNHENLRESRVRLAKEKVKKYYNWDENLKSMEQIYQRL